MVNRIQPPSINPISSIKLQEPIVDSTRNGIPVYIFNYDKNDALRFEIVFYSGKWEESHPSVSYFTAKMLMEGTSKFSASEIAEKLEYYGAFIELTSGYDFTTLSAYCLNYYIPKLTDLFKEILNNSIFPKKQLDILKNIRIQSLLTENKKSDIVATKLIKSQLFGSNHPYGNSINEKDIEEININAVLEYYKVDLLKSKKKIFLSGNLKNESHKLLLECFEELTQGTGENKTYEKRPEEKIRVIDWDNSVQTSLRLAMPSVGKTHIDFHKLLILNEIFGGYFGSRLMQNIREDKGLTYGIYSQIIPLLRDSYFLISAEIKKGIGDKVKEEIINEITRLKTEAIEIKELERVKNYLKGSFLSSINSPFAITDKFKSVCLFELNLEFYNNHLAQIDNVTSEELKDLSVKYLKEELFYESLVG